MEPNATAARHGTLASFPSFDVVGTYACVGRWPAGSPTTYPCFHGVRVFFSPISVKRYNFFRARQARSTKGCTSEVPRTSRTNETTAGQRIGLGVKPTN
ncbi:trehalose-6-phosphatase [Anopheles sinensis]|uniref:Trehalose-6-phosphatase n=1 Tax=Anopheles sinensis TaxID=74873 RepID=A0A084VU65_ANOSI|nr:trehalose-6-phosphatase [Anopheles sinensis]